MLTRYNIRERDWTAFNDIIVFDRDVGELMRAPYPMLENGQPISPGGVHKFLERRGLFWECECARFNDHCCAIRWIGGNERSTGICTHDPPQCAFLLDLEKIVISTTYRNTYRQYPTLAKLSNEWRRSSWPRSPRSRRMRSSFPTAATARTLILGSYQHTLSPSTKPLELVKQKPRLSLPQPLHINQTLNIARTPSPQPSTSYTVRSPRLPAWKIARSPTPEPLALASPSSSDRASCLVEHHEQERILLRLMRGEGISRYENQDLIEQCDSCLMHFLNIHLRSHIPTCSNKEEEDDVSEALRRYRQREVSVEV